MDTSLQEDHNKYQKFWPEKGLCPNIHVGKLTAFFIHPGWLNVQHVAGAMHVNSPVHMCAIKHCISLEIDSF